MTQPVELTCQFRSIEPSDHSKCGRLAKYQITYQVQCRDEAEKRNGCEMHHNFMHKDETILSSTCCKIINGVVANVGCDWRHLQNRDGSDAKSEE